jgi:hypothetical protein
MTSFSLAVNYSHISYKKEREFNTQENVTDLSVNHENRHFLTSFLLEAVIMQVTFIALFEE